MYSNQADASNKQAMSIFGYGKSQVELEKSVIYLNIRIISTARISAFIYPIYPLYALSDLCDGICVLVGLVLFHSHALSQLPPEEGARREEHMNMMRTLLETLGNSITELKDMHEQYSVLNSSGKAMLNQMVAVAQYACIV